MYGLHGQEQGRQQPGERREGRLAEPVDQVDGGAAEGHRQQAPGKVERRGIDDPRGLGQERRRKGGMPDQSDRPVDAGQQVQQQRGIEEELRVQVAGGDVVGVTHDHVLVRVDEGVRQPPRDAVQTHVHAIADDEQKERRRPRQAAPHEPPQTAHAIPAHDTLTSPSRRSCRSRAAAHIIRHGERGTLRRRFLCQGAQARRVSRRSWLGVWRRTRPAVCRRPGPHWRRRWPRRGSRPRRRYGKPARPW